MANQSGIGFLVARLALQNLGRRKARTLLLVAAVAICSGAVFTGAVLIRSIESSMSVGFTRLGADMLVVPAGTLTNITAALLTAEPTDLTLDDGILARLAALKGVQRVAPQLVFRTDVGLSTWRRPRRFHRVRPRARPHRPAMVGATSRPAAARWRRDRRRATRRGGGLGAFGVWLAAYGHGRLGKTAVGTHERGLFISFATLAEMRVTMQQICGMKAPLEPNKLSGILLQLAPGVTTQQVRFGVLANFPGVKVVSGESMLTSIRQGLTALLGGVLALMAIMFVSTALMVSVLFSAIIPSASVSLGCSERSERGGIRSSECC